MNWTAVALVLGGVVTAGLGFVVVRSDRVHEWLRSIGEDDSER